jgi:hypothetical protein
VIDEEYVTKSVERALSAHLNIITKFEAAADSSPDNVAVAYLLLVLTAAAIFSLVFASLWRLRQMTRLWDWRGKIIAVASPYLIGGLFMGYEYLRTGMELEVIVVGTWMFLLASVISIVIRGSFR